jgi:uncharacterized protein (TIGR02599 family)
MKQVRFHPAGFSLLEILVSTAIIGIVLVAIGEAMSTMQTTWTRTRAKADTFRPLRVAVETMNRRLASATLESRWVREEDPADGTPTGSLVRSSHLHFVSGPALQLTGSSGTLVSHGVFFQAPFGMDNQRRDETPTNRYDQLTHLLNAWGYFVEYGPDPGVVPAFIAQEDPRRGQQRRRFRLLEYRQPTEKLPLFTPGTNTDGTPEMDTLTSEARLRDWFADALLPGGNLQRRSVSVLAENIVALVIRPIAGGTLDELARTASGTQYDLAEDMVYDTRRHQYQSGLLADQMRHRLPSALEVTVVATSEDSWARLLGAEVELAASEIRAATNSGFLTATQYERDLKRLTDVLSRREIEHRVLRSVVTLPEGSKE